MIMAEEKASLLEESVPWEVKLLEDYCRSKADLESVSYLHHA